LYKYIYGILRNLGQYPLAINGYKDHVHIFFELQPTKCLSDIMRDIKTNSSKWINENNYVKGRFSWQQGYGGFSYSKTQRDSVIKYIINQEKHHQKNTFEEEYMDLLSKFNIEFKEEYIFDFYDL
ncbi:MAG TPA: transposase, partial [Bacteroidales bacterium]|nr:transposase [Bacteroidales bacterium]